MHRPLNGLEHFEQLTALLNSAAAQQLVLDSRYSKIGKI